MIRINHKFPNSSLCKTKLMIKDIFIKTEMIKTFKMIQVSKTLLTYKMLRIITTKANKLFILTKI